MAREYTSAQRGRRRAALVGRPRRPLARLAAELARDHLRHAVAAHADAVEAVGRVHRALLVGDDDELGAVGVAAHELEEAVDVEVVERGLDLVEDVERARAREEHGEHERERDERLLAARQQRQPLHRLAGRRDLDLDARLLGLGRSSASALLGGRASPSACASASSPPSTGRGPSGCTSRSRPRPPGEQVRDHLLEVLRRRPRRSPRSSRGCAGRCP